VWACIRDAHGRFVQAFAKKFDGKPDVAEAEAVGLLEAIQWIQNSHMPIVHVETDSFKWYMLLEQMLGIILSLARLLICVVT
jgi:hypothetical protein